MKNLLISASSVLALSLAALTMQGCAEANPATPAANAAALPKVSGQALKELPDGITLVERMDEPEGQGAIPYAKYKLDNGLTVLITPDHSDPLVHVDISYDVGSARETPGLSGFAHFFEHMMFQGSQHVGDKQHSRIISEVGGSMNGGTTVDTTKYYQTVPANQLETVLWLEADRMGFLLPSVTQTKFENQRDTVKNERAENYDNAPYGLVNERTAEALFPKDHPYSWPTIGYVEDLNRVDVDDLKAFFLRWYGPNNAVLTIGGDVDEAQTLEWVAKYFGTIPTGPEVEPLDKPLITLDKTRYITLEDDVALGVVYVSYPTVYAVHEDEAPLDVLMTMMGRGRASLLHKNLSANGDAARTDASHGCNQLACSFGVFAMRSAGTNKSLGDLYQEILDTFAEFESTGANQANLDRLTMWIVSNMIYGLQSVSGKVDQLSFYELMHGNPNFSSADIARYKAVTTDDVMRVYRKYIKDKPAVVLSVVPRDSGLEPVAPQNWTPPARTFPPQTEQKPALRPIEDNFDRSQKPSPSGTVQVTAPELYETKLRNGLKISGAVNDETPTTTIVIQMPGGQRSDPADKLGLSSLTAKVLSGKTLDRSSETIAQELETLGSKVSFSYDISHNFLLIQSLTENLDKTLEIVKERLLRPGWDSKELYHIWAGSMDEIMESRRDPAAVASLAIDRVIYGDNPMAYREQGTTESVRGINRTDIINYFGEYYRPEGSIALVVSDLPQRDIKSKLSILEDWSGKAKTPASITPLKEIEETKIYFVDFPGAVQSQVKIARPGPAFDATGEHFKLTVMNFALGSEFNSRLNINLREDKGWTYWAGSSLGGTKEYGVWLATSGVRTDVTVDALKEMLSEIENYSENGPSEADYKFTQDALGQSKALKFEKPFDKMALMSDMTTYDLDASFTEEQSRLLKSLTRNELKKLAGSFLDVDKMAIVVVGDRETIFPDIEDLGYPIVELDKDGNLAE